MPSRFLITDEVRDAMSHAAGSLLNGGSIEIWEVVGDGDPPDSPTTPIVDDDFNHKKLAECSFALLAFGDPADGSVVSNPVGVDQSAAKSGVAEFFRFRGSLGQPLMQGTAGSLDDDPDMIFDNPVIVAGGAVAISSVTITQPGAED